MEKTSAAAKEAALMAQHYAMLAEEAALEDGQAIWAARQAAKRLQQIRAEARPTASPAAEQNARWYQQIDTRAHSCGSEHVVLEREAQNSITEGDSQPAFDGPAHTAYMESASANDTVQSAFWAVLETSFEPHQEEDCLQGYLEALYEDTALAIGSHFTQERSPAVNILPSTTQTSGSAVQGTTAYRPTSPTAGHAGSAAGEAVAIAGDESLSQAEPAASELVQDTGEQNLLHARPRAVERELPAVAAPLSQARPEIQDPVAEIEEDSMRPEEEPHRRDEADPSIRLHRRVAAAVGMKGGRTPLWARGDSPVNMNRLKLPCTQVRIVYLQ